MRPEMFPAAGVPDPAPRPRPDLDWLKRVDLSETVPPEAISVQGIMASIMRRTWTSRGPTGHKVKEAAWGYTLQVKGKQERKFSGEWTRETAQQALAARTLQLDAEDPRAPRTLGQVAQEYLDYKRAKGKKSLPGAARPSDVRHDPAVCPPKSRPPARRRRESGSARGSPGFSTWSAQSDRIARERLVSTCRAVSSVGRAPDF